MQAADKALIASHVFSWGKIVVLVVCNGIILDKNNNESFKVYTLIIL